MTLPADQPLPLETATTRSQRSPFEKARRRMSAVAVLAFLVAALLNEPLASRKMFNESLEYAGFALLIVAAFGRIWTGAYLGGRKTRELCTTGPFSVSRNPLYFFSMLAATGLGLLSESVILTVAVLLVFVVYYHFVIRDEEKRLREAFGATFNEYCRQVPRLIPKWSKFRDEPTVLLHTRPFLRTIRDTSLFIWVFLLFELFELLEIGVGHRVMPVGWHLF